MKIFKFKDYKSLIHVFDNNFICSNKTKFKIVYKNKIYPFINEFVTSVKSLDNMKIKIISFINFSDISNNTEFLKMTNIFEENNKYTKKKRNKYNVYFKCSLFEMSIIEYIIDKKDNKIRIFGKNFVEKNKNKCIIIYKDKIFPLQEYFSKEDIEKEEKMKLEITLIELGDITDRSYMFHKCNLLKEFPLSKDNFKELDNNFDTNNNFTGNNLLDSIKSQKLYNYKLGYMKKEVMEGYNKESSSITSILNEYPTTTFLPDKSNWFTCNCFNLNSIFSGCESLISLPDLSKWNTSKVIDMSNMFKGCSSLTSLPDISRWNIKNVTNLNLMFNRCSSLPYSVFFHPLLVP